MSYNSMYLMSEDQELRGRLVACAAKEGVVNPQLWVSQQIHALVTSPGWDAAWDSALALGPGIRPGSMPNVITDQMILSVVQAKKPVT